jgi:alcohol dehydrogenase
VVLSRPFYCPTQVHTNLSYIEAVGNLVGDSKWGFVTSSGWIKRGALDSLSRMINAPTFVIDSTPSNPRISDVINLSSNLAEIDVIVALGGGSVIDAAKGVAALITLDGDVDVLRSHLKDGKELINFSAMPIIAVPTTSGTGSEVTRWATIWGDDKVKFSLQHPALYPRDAVLDPALCVSMPEELTIASGLDGLSHAMEAIWNVNHTPISDSFAANAINTIWNDLPRVLQNPQDLKLRDSIQIATLISGLAMGTTQTALAHSISYPFTAHYGMPHGLACSFTLPEVVRYNLDGNDARFRLIAGAIGCNTSEIADRLDGWFRMLNIANYVAKYVTADAVDQFGDELITRARAANNLRAIDGPKAREISKRSLNALFAAGNASNASV